MGGLKYTVPGKLPNQKELRARRQFAFLFKLGFVIILSATCVSGAAIGNIRIDQQNNKVNSQIRAMRTKISELDKEILQNINRKEELCSKEHVFREVERLNLGLRMHSMGQLQELRARTIRENDHSFRIWAHNNAVRRKMTATR